MGCLLGESGARWIGDFGILMAPWITGQDVSRVICSQTSGVFGRTVQVCMGQTGRGRSETGNSRFGRRASNAASNRPLPGAETALFLDHRYFSGAPFKCDPGRRATKAGLFPPKCRGGPTRCAGMSLAAGPSGGRGDLRTRKTRGTDASISESVCEGKAKALNGRGIRPFDGRVGHPAGGGISDPQPGRVVVLWRPSGKKWPPAARQSPWAVPGLP